MEIQLDEGFQFGLGAFETIAVVENHPVFLREHLKRLEGAQRFLGISQPVSETEVYAWISAHPMDNGALKIAVSKENRLFLPRENHYTEEMYDKGFTAGFAETRRNETSPLTGYKTMNYGDCILEKRRASDLGWDEAVFLNTRGEICEGTVSNIFFVKDGNIYTPEKCCGILPGIMRGYLMENYTVEEGVFFPEDLGQFSECFVTNSLMGVMPVMQLGERVFERRGMADCLRKEYRREVQRIILS